MTLLYCAVFCVLSVAHAQENTTIKVPPELAEKIHITIAKMTAAGEHLRTCLLQANTDQIQLRDILVHQTQANNEVISIQEAYATANSKSQELRRLTPNPDIRRQYDETYRHLQSIQAQQMNIGGLLEKLRQNNAKFNADLSQQQSCMQTGP